MLKRTSVCALALLTFAVAACGPATVNVQGQEGTNLGLTAAASGSDATETPAPAVYYTETSSPAAPRATFEIQGDASAQASIGLEGTWQITSFASNSSSVLGDTDAQAYLGKQAVITSDSISFDGQTCANVSIQRHTIDPATYLGLDAATLAAKLGLTQSQIDLIDTTCTLTGFQSFVQADPNTLVINVSGTFFVLRK